jgi:hypothetical protein
LVESYSTIRLVTFLAKNVGSFMFGEQQLLIKFSTIFVIHMLDIATTKRLVEVHNKHTKGQDFQVNFEVCKTFLFICLLSFHFGL